MTDFAVVDPDEVAAEPFPESGLSHRKLTEQLGCTDVRVNAVTLAPGEATAPHAHERQEELYVAPGAVVRVGPDPVRRVHNDSDEPRTWLMFGAPPVGTVDNFGEYTVPEK